MHLEKAWENLSRLMTRLGGFVTLYRDVYISRCYRGLFKVPRECERSTSSCSQRDGFKI